MPQCIYTYYIYIFSIRNISTAFIWHDKSHNTQHTTYLLMKNLVWWSTVNTWMIRQRQRVAEYACCYSMFYLCVANFSSVFFWVCVCLSCFNSLCAVEKYTSISAMVVFIMLTRCFIHKYIYNTIYWFVQTRRS